MARTLIEIGLAGALLLGSAFVQAKYDTATWAYCQASESYACHVWLGLYRRGEIK